MGISALALVSTVLVLTAYHHSHRHPVPASIKAIILRGLACLLLMRLRGHKSEQTINPAANQIHHQSANQSKDGTGENQQQQIDVVKYVMMMKMKQVKSEVEEKNQRDWESVAQVIDRFFLLVFCLLILISLFVIIDSLVSNNNSGYIERFPYLIDGTSL